MYTESLETDHHELDIIYREALDALASGDAPAALGRVDLFWARLAVHIRAEHLRLFPAVPHTAENDAVVARLRHDHDEFMTALANAVKLLRGHATPECVSEARRIVLELGDALAEHNRLEEETVYCDAGNHMSHAERAELALSIDAELQNIPPRFSAHGV